MASRSERPQRSTIICLSASLGLMIWSMIIWLRYLLTPESGSASAHTWLLNHGLVRRPPQVGYGDPLVEVLAVEEPQERLGLALGGWEVGQTIAPNALDLLAHPVKSSMPRFPCSTLHRLTLTGRKSRLRCSGAAKVLRRPRRLGRVVASGRARAITPRLSEKVQVTLRTP